MKIDSNKLCDVMAEQGIFIDDLCNRTGMQRKKICELLAGSPETDQATVDRIAVVLHVPVHDIVLDGGKMVPVSR